VSSPAQPALRRAPLPEGTLPVGFALLIAGVATYAFFRVGQRALGGDEEFAPISALWFATFSLAPGLLPAARAGARAGAVAPHARDEGGRPVVAGGPARRGITTVSCSSRCSSPAR
jgi:hypothetical protein